MENEPNNVEEHKEVHTESESESNSKFENPRKLLTLETVSYQGYDSAGKFINFHLNCMKWPNCEL